MRFDNPVEAQFDEDHPLLDQSRERSTPEVEAVCEVYDCHDYIHFVNRLFHIRTLINTFHEVPDFLKPLSKWETLGVVFVEEELKKYEQHEMLKQSRKADEASQKARVTSSPSVSASKFPRRGF